MYFVYPKLWVLALPKSISIDVLLKCTLISSNIWETERCIQGKPSQVPKSRTIRQSLPSPFIETQQNQWNRMPMPTVWIWCISIYYMNHKWKKSMSSYTGCFFPVAIGLQGQVATVWGNHGGVDFRWIFWLCRQTFHLNSSPVWQELSWNVNVKRVQWKKWGTTSKRGPISMTVNVAEGVWRWLRWWFNHGLLWQAIIRSSKPLPIGSGSDGSVALFFPSFFWRQAQRMMGSISACKLSHVTDHTVRCLFFFFHFFHVFCSKSIFVAAKTQAKCLQLSF